MRKIKFALAASAFLAAAFAFGLAQAAPAMPLPAQDYSPIENAGCTGAGPRCPWGRTWVCGPRGFCRCVRCGGYYGGPLRYPLRPWRWRY
jgi:hypothetical protein